MFNRFVKLVKHLVEGGADIGQLKTVIKDNFLRTEHTQLTKGYINTNDMFPIFDAEYKVPDPIGKDCLVFNNIKKSEMDELKDLIKAVRNRIIENDLEKSKKLPVGTIRTWGGVDYKKVGEGKWSPFKTSDKNPNQAKYKKEKHKELREQYKEHQKEKKEFGSSGDIKVKVKEFSDSDWNAFAGAEEFESGERPLIGEGEFKDGMDFVVILAGNGVSVMGENAGGGDEDDPRDFDYSKEVGFKNQAAAKRYAAELKFASKEDLEEAGFKLR